MNNDYDYITRFIPSLLLAPLLFRVEERTTTRDTVKLKNDMPETEEKSNFLIPQQSSSHFSIHTQNG